MKNMFLLLGLIAIGFQSVSQKVFSEGLIKYDVYINDSSEPSGIYIISVKSGNIKREIAMNSGYNNITLFTQKTGTTLSLNVKGNNKYALELHPEELKEKNKKFENASYTSLNKDKKIAGYPCLGMQIKYVNNETAEFFYTKDLIPQGDNFNMMFPGLKGIPLEYKVKSSVSLTMKFVATQIEIKAIDSEVFTIPSDYKIISMEELQMMK